MSGSKEQASRRADPGLHYFVNTLREVLGLLPLEYSGSAARENYKSELERFGRTYAEPRNYRKTPW